jgi:two-component system response regulator FlrC
MEAVADAKGQAAPAKLSKIVKLSEARAIMDTLESVGGHRANAARALGISERTLRYRLASFREAGIAMGAAR